MKTKLLSTLFTIFCLIIHAQYIVPVDTHVISVTKPSEIKKSNLPTTIVPKNIKDNGLISDPIHENEGENKSEENEKILHDKFLKKLNDTSKIKGAEIDIKYKSNNPQTLSTPPTILSSFFAQQMANGTPPDNSIAISNSGIIINADNNRINIYGVNGSLLNSWTYPSFFSTTNTAWSDPRVIYDSGADRFIFEIQSGSSSSNSFVNVCFSSTNNPLDPWYVYPLSSEFTSQGYWFDYSNIAVSTAELFVSGNLAVGNTTSGNIIYQIDKNQGYAGANITYM